MTSDLCIPQSQAIKDGSNVLVTFGVSRVLCHMDSSTATTDMMLFCGSRVLFHLD